MKRLALLLTLLIVLSSADACTEQQQQAAPNAGDVAASDALPEVTLTFIFFDVKKPATDDVWNAISEQYKDQLNAKFDVQFIAGSDYKDRILVKAAAGDKWDLNFEGDWLSYFQMANLNAYLPLDDLLPEYAPNLYSVYEQSGVLNAAKSKGNIVALPWTNVMSNRPTFQWRNDLYPVDASTINTIEDIDALLYKLKAEFPDKYIVENAGWETFQLKHELIGAGNDFFFNADDENITVQHVATTEAYKERARYAEKWQADGLIWADVLVDQLDHNQLINQGQLITKFGTHEFAHSARAWVEPDAEWGWNFLYPDMKFANRTALANIVAIPRTAENPERTLMWLDLVETDEAMYDLVHYGIEDVTYVRDGDEIKFPGDMNAATSNYQLWQGRWALFKPQFMHPDAEYGPNFWANEKAAAESNPNNIVSVLDGFNFDTEPVTNEIAQIKQLYDDANKMLDVGLAGPADATVDALGAELNRAGLEAVTAEMQAQVNTFLGK
jgi:putative aldouronate transport system substrate-binding protein